MWTTQPAAAINLFGDAPFFTAAAVYLSAILVGYFLGSIPFGYFVGRRYGIDIRTHGSGNIGATNVLRVLGRKPGYVVFICDMLKGVVAVVLVNALAQTLIASAIDHGRDLFGVVYPSGIASPEGFRAYLHAAALPASIVAAIACILGHNFPVWLRFRGGKGVATTVGVLLGLMPLALLATAVVWLTVFYTLRYVSLASLLAVTILPISVWVSEVRPHPRDWPLFAFSLVAMVLMYWRHRGNISRLLSGTEPRFVRPPDPAQPLP